MTLDQLRQKHPRFYYRSFGMTEEQSGLHVFHRFDIEPDVHFQTKTLLPIQAKQLSHDDLFHFVFQLGLIEMISYWKAICSPEIIVEAGALREDQIVWWKKLLMNGLGEFFYINNIDFSVKDFVTLRSTQTNFVTSVNESGSLTPDLNQSYQGNLILVSGGKDSSVMLELLQPHEPDSELLLVNPTQAAIDQAKIAGYQNPIIVQRTIDPQLIKLNKQGYLNGHTPFSAYLAFLGTTIATMYKKKYVIVANEKSASEGNLTFHGMPINHQYSKSYGFESAFRNYAKTYLPTNSEYFSFLRPIYDLQVAKLFSSFTKFHSSFRSCNVGQKLNIWCGTCSKCAFVYLSLFPFLNFEQIHSIFGSDFFVHPEICEHLKGLVGIENIKPFECVGTVEESKLAIALSIEKYEKEGRPLPPILEELKVGLNIQSNQDLSGIKQNILHQWSNEHFLPDQFAEILRKNLTTNY